MLALRDLGAPLRDLERRVAIVAPRRERALRVRDEPRLTLRAKQFEIVPRELRGDRGGSRLTIELGAKRGYRLPLAAGARRQALEHLRAVARHERRAERARDRACRTATSAEQRAAALARRRRNRRTRRPSEDVVECIGVLVAHEVDVVHQSRSDVLGIGDPGAGERPEVVRFARNRRRRAWPVEPVELGEPDEPDEPASPYESGWLEQPAKNTAAARNKSEATLRFMFVSSLRARLVAGAAAERRVEVRERRGEVRRSDRRAVRVRQGARRRIRRHAAEHLRLIQRAEHAHRRAQLDVDDVVARPPAVREARRVAREHAEIRLRSRARSARCSCSSAASRPAP